MEPTASLTSIAQLTGAPEFKLKVEIGTPYRVVGPTGNWACPVLVHPLHERLHDIHGIDAFQALCLAVRFSIQLLDAFVDEGGKLFGEDGVVFNTADYGYPRTAHFH